MKHFKIAALGIALSTAVCTAVGQSFSIDMDIPTDPALGGGAPTAQFSGASGTPGYWNKIPAAGFGTHFLRGLDGNLTSAKIIGPEGGSGGGHNLPINSGDYAALLNDARSVGIAGSILNFSFDGLANGTYIVHTYAVSITTTTEARLSSVTVAQAIQPIQFVSGPMPGNQLIEGITHTSHTAQVTLGVIDVSISALTAPGAWFNGIQLVAVPEPSSMVAMSAAAAFFIRKRRGPRQDAMDLRLSSTE